MLQEHQVHLILGQQSVIKSNLASSLPCSVSNTAKAIELLLSNVRNLLKISKIQDANCVEMRLGRSSHELSRICFRHDMKLIEIMATVYDAV